MEFEVTHASLSENGQEIWVDLTFGINHELIVFGKEPEGWEIKMQSISTMPILTFLYQGGGNSLILNHPKVRLYTLFS